MSFSQFALNDKLLAAMIELGYKRATPIQEQAIPAVLQGYDILAGAQTGTGKTAAFSLPLLEKLGEEHQEAPRALILTPTRELAAQIDENIQAFAKYLDLKSTVVYGGVGMGGQIERIKEGVDIIVATPGRLIDLCLQRELDLSKVETLILDEADRMLDMGFIHDIDKIIKRLPAKRQNLMFSATYSLAVRELAATLLHRPVAIEVAKENSAAEKVKQKAFGVSQMAKTEFLIDLIKKEDWFQVLVFTRTKPAADRVTDELKKAGIPAAAIHGDKSQNVRTRALKAFKEGKTQALVATDVAARGIDIDQLEAVVNYELPNVAEDYVHRIGRTGRAGHDGLAVSLVSFGESRYLAAIEKLLKKKIRLDIQPSYNDRPPKSDDDKETKSGKTAGFLGKSSKSTKKTTFVDKGNSSQKNGEGIKPSSDRRNSKGGKPKSKTSVKAKQSAKKAKAKRKSRRK